MHPGTHSHLRLGAAWRAALPGRHPGGGGRRWRGRECRQARATVFDRFERFDVFENIEQIEPIGNVRRRAGLLPSPTGRPLRQGVGGTSLPGQFGHCGEGGERAQSSLSCRTGETRKSGTTIQRFAYASLSFTRNLDNFGIGEGLRGCHLARLAPDSCSGQSRASCESQRRGFSFVPKGFSSTPGTRSQPT